jgi:uncharacterized protein (DUF2237 family)
MAKNVLGGDLKPCCKFPMTGFYRDGSCNTGPEDLGNHTVCIRVTDKFLAFSKEAGNNLSTPRPELDFPGLIAGDQWCLCALRFQEALEAGCAPKVVLKATHEKTLTVTNIRDLKAHEYVDDGTTELK